MNPVSFKRQSACSNQDEKKFAVYSNFHVSFHHVYSLRYRLAGQGFRGQEKEKDVEYYRTKYPLRFPGHFLRRHAFAPPVVDECPEVEILDWAGGASPLDDYRDLALGGICERASENRVSVLSAARSDSPVTRGGIINALSVSEPLRASDLIPIVRELRNGAYA